VEAALEPAGSRGRRIAAERAFACAGQGRPARGAASCMGRGPRYDPCTRARRSSDHLAWQRTHDAFVGMTSPAARAAAGSFITFIGT
jgi:hypothetical protein